MDETYKFMALLKIDFKRVKHLVGEGRKYCKHLKRYTDGTTGCRIYKRRPQFCRNFPKRIIGSAWAIKINNCKGYKYVMG